MRVEKLELIGFKSFGDRTVFHLHPGITCIVGPNGCGKSNVVDSFKWVLGEQSAKSLRGGKMEEVIFAGSQNKKPRGMAETSLYISGLGGSGNGNDSVTTVTRRLYRSGDSEYMLNKTACRLRDIRDIFLDTGLEVKSYSILEQDRISAILNAKPDERRFIIEEVAGVVKYKVRRNEAQSKLESSRNNLQRISDIVAEVRRQINSLDRQVKRAERYKRLMEELKGIELKIARRDFTALSEALEEVLSEYGSLKEEHAIQRAEFSEVEADIEAGRIGLVEKEKALDGLKQELQGIEREMAEAERLLAVLRTERDNLREYTVKLRVQVDENRTKHEESRQRRQEAEEAEQSLQGEIHSLRNELSEREADLKAMEAAISEDEQVLDSKRRETFRASEDLGDLRNELNRYGASLENLRSREETLRRETNELNAVLEDIVAQAREVESAMLGKNSEILAVRDQKEHLVADLEEKRRGLEELRARTARTREELASASSRLESLREVVFSESSEEELKSDVELLASVSDVIEVSREYEKAIESALREVISGFVVSSYDDVKHAVQALREKGMGRTAFVPASVDGARGEVPVPEGAVARASDLVRCGEEFARVAGALLGNVVVVRTLDDALAMRGTGATLVTLEGEILEPSGVVTAGKSKGILSLKRQIREISEEIEGRRARIEALEKDTLAAVEAQARAEADLKNMAEREVDIEKELSLLRHRDEELARNQERTNRKLAMLKIEAQQVAGEKESLEANIREKEAEIARGEEGKKLSEATMGDIQGRIAEKKAAYEGRRTESVELRLSLNSRTERLNSLRGEMNSLEALMKELSEKEEFIHREIGLTETRIQEKEQEAEGREGVLRELAVKASGMSARIASQRDLIAAEAEELSGREKGLKALRSRIEEYAERLSELDVRRAENTLKRENLAVKIREAYGVDLEAYEAEDVTPEEEERLPELKQKIENIGPVSLGSIEEYEELKERYDFLTKQQEDLNQSIAELDEAIKRINATTRKRLREAYDALKVKFSEVFVTLFGGGRAELVLTDESNILETGVDIVAQPPGKKFQNITLLSGGEKTLTALALLFASFLIKPTPLCILDEADAALDESNTHKFSQMIKELSRDIQFVVVTHNRVTMEAADHIYGITMEEPGISKVISMQFAEA